jgi:hypothetical protein
LTNNNFYIFFNIENFGRNTNSWHFERFYIDAQNFLARIFSLTLIILRSMLNDGPL